MSKQTPPQKVHGGINDTAKPINKPPILERIENLEKLCEHLYFDILIMKKALAIVLEMEGKHGKKNKSARFLDRSENWRQGRGLDPAFTKSPTPQNKPVQLLCPFITAEWGTKCDCHKEQCAVWSDRRKRCGLTVKP